MCGIVGYTGHRSSLPILLSGLQRLEYRGYDSAGVALVLNQEIKLARSVGRLINLVEATNLQSELQSAQIGIGHTRWATHGGPSEVNAHPHLSSGVALVHNGIIENYRHLRKSLEALGYIFNSETDTEVAAHLLHQNLFYKNLSPENALSDLMDQVQGSFAFVALSDHQPQQILAARRASPLVIGVGDGEVFLASDVTAILEYTRQVIYLEDDDYAVIEPDSIKIYNSGLLVQRPVKQVTWDLSQAQRGGYPHFMIKEIFDQPKAINDTLSGRLYAAHQDFRLPEIENIQTELKDVRRVKIVACGTAWHAALVAKSYFETIAGIICEVEVASEFRYQQAIIRPDDLLIAVSQSGETADTLAAVDLAQGKCITLGITNVLGSSLARKVQSFMLTQAGPEISVASTKAFVTQVLALYLLALKLGSLQGRIQRSDLIEKLDHLTHLSSSLTETLNLEKKIKSIADRNLKFQNYFFLGRGTAYPIALEGALKLKEVSYLSAQGYPAGELKHGPIALIDPEVMTLAVVQDQEPYFSKTLSNLSEVRARKGKMLIVSDAANKQEELLSVCDELLIVPHINSDLAPILLTVPLQLYAYYIAFGLDREIDCPRNLAKSVTVE